VKQPLASDNDLAGSPVDVVELESYYLTSAETETGKQQKNGVVTAAGRRATVASFEHTVDFFQSQILGHGGQPPISYGGNRSGQVGVQFPLLKQVPEERAESRDHDLCSSDTHAGAMAQNKIRNVGRFHFSKKKRPLWEALNEKLTDERLVTENGGDNKPAL
jgi:hypothetical protein